MTEKEIKLVKQLQHDFVEYTRESKSAGIQKIKENFRKEFTVDVTKEPKYVLDLLEKAYSEKNSNDIEFILSIIDIFDVFSTAYQKEYKELLVKLLAADWHVYHEDIAHSIQRLKIPEAVDCLYETALKQFKYRDYDDFSVLAVQCIWALGDIGTQEAIEKLKLLAQLDNEIIKENALKQLARI